MLIEYTVSYLQVNLNHITTIQWASLDVLDKRPVNKNFIVHVSVLSIFRLREWRGFHITKQITSELSHVMPADLYTLIQLLPPYPHPTHEMGWGRGRDGDVMYMNACYCYILVRVFYYCLFITVLHSSSWWVCKLSPHCFSSYTWSTSTLFLIIHMIKVPVLINSNSRYRMSQMILLKVNYKYKFKKIT